MPSARLCTTDAKNIPPSQCPSLLLKSAQMQQLQTPSVGTKGGGLIGLWLKHHFGDQQLTFLGRAGNALGAKVDDLSLIPRFTHDRRRGQTIASSHLTWSYDTHAHTINP